MSFQRIGIVGGGAWGTALAQVSASDGSDVLMWVLEQEVADSINGSHVNAVYLPGISLSPAIRATTDLAELASCDFLLLVAPAQHLRTVLAGLPRGDVPLILCAKGIEANTQMLMSEVASDVSDAPIAVLSGPTFAFEVANGLPTAVTLACEDEALGRTLAARIARPTFRPYASTDVIGAEIGGAVKNVLAIGCGVVEGRGLGQNARAALISRGFAEMTRFGLARGARPETLAGLSGLGDLVLTCSSTSSRNFSLGKGLGQGRTAAEVLADKRSIAEGAFTAPVLQQAARAVGVDMPVVDAVCAMLTGEAHVDAVVESLMARPLRTEG